MPLNLTYRTAIWNTGVRKIGRLLSVQYFQYGPVGVPMPAQLDTQIWLSFWPKNFLIICWKCLYRYTLELSQQDFTETLPTISVTFTEKFSNISKKYFIRISKKVFEKFPGISQQLSNNSAKQFSLWFTQISFTLFSNDFPAVFREISDTFPQNFL